MALADQHGHGRWAQRYRLDELVRELAVAQRVILREVLDPAVGGGEAPGPEAASLGRERIGRFFEDVLAASSERFAQDAGRSLEGANRHLREISASRLALLQAVTHELRGYLQTFTLALDVVASGAPEAERQRMVAVCRRDLADMAALLEELTDYGVLLAGQVRPEPEAVGVADFAQGIAAGFGLLARASGVELRVAVEPGLGTVRCDPRRLRQILGNLIGNAVKYRRRDGTGAWVRVAFEGASEGGWRVAVEDNGRGIAPQDLERVFEDFQRVTPREGVHGTGLGLAITRRLARLLGGEVSVTSTPGAGSRFEVVLPRALAQAASLPDEPALG